MRRLLTFILCIALLSNINAIAADPGDGNIDGSGGGGMGSGSSGNKWSTGNDGVRITVLDARNELPVTAPVDFSNKTHSSATLHFGKVSKAHYKAGATITLSSGADYVCFVHYLRNLPYQPQ